MERIRKIINEKDTEGDRDLGELKTALRFVTEKYTKALIKAGDNESKQDEFNLDPTPYIAEIKDVLFGHTYKNAIKKWNLEPETILKGL